MSAFDGHLLEYPFVSVDRFDGTNLSSAVYFLSHCHKDHIEGLLEQVFLDRLKYGHPDVKLYASETTRNLMLCDPEMQHIVKYTIGLPVNQQTSFSVKVENIEKNMVVTLISAGHCVGSVMFLFEGSKGAVLYTGDFRLRAKEISKVQCLHSGSTVRHIKSMYVDTTFCCPKVPDLPTRVDTRDCLISIIKKWIVKGSNYMVHLKCKGRYGYEYIMKEVAKHFKTKIHVNNWRIEMSGKLPDMLKHFTTEPSLTQVHCCYYGKNVSVPSEPQLVPGASVYQSINSSYNLPCGLKEVNGEKIKMITIVPSSLYFVRNGIPDGNQMWIPSQKLWRVVHSMHASYSEIREVVKYLRPRNIYPFVPPADCQDILEAYERLQDLQQNTSTSQNSDVIDNENDTEVNDATLTWTANLQNDNLLSPRSAARHHETLGIDERVNLMSPPPCRKRKRIRAMKDEEEDFNKLVVKRVVDEMTGVVLNRTLDEERGTISLKSADLSNSPTNECCVNVDVGEKYFIEILSKEEEFNAVTRRTFKDHSDNDKKSRTSSESSESSDTGAIASAGEENDSSKLLFDSYPGCNDDEKYCITQSSISEQNQHSKNRHGDTNVSKRSILPNDSKVEVIEISDDYETDSDSDRTLSLNNSAECSQEF